jgi:ATP phosphoribosyltransferase
MSPEADTKNTSLIRIAMPRKGRIAEQLKPLCKEAGYRWPSSDGNKSLIAKLAPNVEVMFVRTSDIPALVADSVVDLGVTGTDVVDEAGLDVQIASALPLFQCELVVAAREAYKREYDMVKPQSMRIATSFPNLALDWGKKSGIDVHIIPLSGSVEIAPRLGIADAIIDLTQSGSTLRTNGLEIIESIRDVEACIIAAPDFPLGDQSARAHEAHTFCEALTSVLFAQGKRYVMMNVPKDSLDAVHDIVPGLSAPTVLDLYENSDIVAVHVVIEVAELNVVIPKLRGVGVHGILVSHIERLIP